MGRIEIRNVLAKLTKGEWSFEKTYDVDNRGSFEYNSKTTTNLESLKQSWDAIPELIKTALNEASRRVAKQSALSHFVYREDIGNALMTIVKIKYTDYPESASSVIKLFKEVFNYGPRATFGHVNTELLEAFLDTKGLDIENEESILTLFEKFKNENGLYPSSIVSTIIYELKKEFEEYIIKAVYSGEIRELFI
jgi:hypothetical protein